MASPPQPQSHHAHQSNNNTRLLPQHHHECSSTSYDQAEAYCHRTIASGHEMMFSLNSFHQEIGRASQQFGLSFEALHSLFRNAHVTHMKRNSHSIRCQTMRHVKSYLNGSSILGLAKKCNYPPSMMARLIVENIAMYSSSSSASTAASAGMGKVVGVAGDGRNCGKNEQSNHNTNPTSAKAKANTITKTATSNNNNTSKKKFVTEALRHPEKTLGCATTSILPEYHFSEKNGTIGFSGGGRQLLDNFSGKPLYAVMANDDDDGNDNDKQRQHPPPLSRLALEVREAVDLDPMYGPRQDRERHNVGIEYELLLEQTLQSMDIPFETEAELRVRGTAKTPDVLLSCPVGLRVRRKKIQNTLYRNSNEEEDTTSFQQKQRIVNLEDDDEYEWKIICWIDSKALFGDVETHTNSVLPQVETYVHRFGPGLVLYWFGHAPLSRLNDGHGDVVIVGGNLPDMLLLPTGEFHGRGGKISV